MFSVIYEQSGLTVKIESDIWLTVFQLQLFDRFSTVAASPDIIHRFHKIEPDTLTAASLGPDQLAAIDRCFLTFYPSALLQSPAVADRLQACFERPDHIRVVTRPHSVVIYDFDRREHDMFFASELERFYSRCKIEPALYTVFWPTFSMMQIHSCGIARKNGAAIFLAPDGGGKTTVARQAPSQDVLCDDQVLVRKNNGVFTASGTPWGTITNKIENCPLGGLFFLEQSDHFELSPVQPQEALEYLWTEHHATIFALPRDIKTAAFQLLSDLCFHIPLYRMRFTPNHIDWDAIDAALKKR